MDKSFLVFYCAARLEDQRTFYHSRINDFDQALRQVRAISTVLMAGVIVANGLESFGLPWLAQLASILAVLFPLLAQALATYSALCAFGPQAQLYQEAADQLDLLALREEDEGLMEAVEAVLEREQGQWPDKLQHSRKEALA